MFFQKSVRSVVLLSVVSAFGLIACGGDGGGDDTAYVPPKAEQAKITTENEKQVAALAASSLSMKTDIPGLNMKMVGSVTPTQKSYKMAYEVVRLSKSAEGYCESGSMDVTDASNNGATLKFSDCVMGEVSINGKMTVAKSQNGENVSGDFDKLRVSYANGDYIFYKEGKLEIIGLGATNSEVSLISMYGESSLGGGKHWYADFSVKVTADASSAKYSISGYLKDDCLKKWVKLETKETVVADHYQVCPKSGKILVTGNDSSLTMTANSDGSVDVEVNGREPVHYDNCTELANGCPVE